MLLRILEDVQTCNTYFLCKYKNHTKAIHIVFYSWAEVVMIMVIEFRLRRTIISVMIIKSGTAKSVQIAIISMRR